MDLTKFLNEAIATLETLSFDQIQQIRDKIIGSSASEEGELTEETLGMIAGGSNYPTEQPLYALIEFARKNNDNAVKLINAVTEHVASQVSEPTHNNR